ncbi:hypothetical protein EDB83DRAFT_286935 [Lactarius deliciosus]|nr:hypothetical protein EDB83DRAFT_286935 [Lactarius deliciosus]
MFGRAVERVACLELASERMARSDTIWLGLLFVSLRDTVRALNWKKLRVPITLPITVQTWHGENVADRWIGKGKDQGRKKRLFSKFIEEKKKEFKKKALINPKP